MKRIGVHLVGRVVVGSLAMSCLLGLASCMGLRDCGSGSGIRKVAALNLTPSVIGFSDATTNDTLFLCFGDHGTNSFWAYDPATRTLRKDIPLSEVTSRRLLNIVRFRSEPFHDSRYEPSADSLLKEMRRRNVRGISSLPPAKQDWSACLVFSDQYSRWPAVSYKTGDATPQIVEPDSNLVVSAFNETSVTNILSVPIPSNPNKCFLSFMMPGGLNRVAVEGLDLKVDSFGLELMLFDSISAFKNGAPVYIWREDQPNEDFQHTDVSGFLDDDNFYFCTSTDGRFTITSYARFCVYNFKANKLIVNLRTPRSLTLVDWALMKDVAMSKSQRYFALSVEGRVRIYELDPPKTNCATGPSPRLAGDAWRGETQATER